MPCPFQATSPLPFPPTHTDHTHNTSLASSTTLLSRRCFAPGATTVSRKLQFGGDLALEAIFVPC